MPPENDPIWVDLVTQKKRIEFDFLAVRILLIRHQLKIRHASRDRDKVIKICAKELYTYFKKKAHLPLAQSDIQKINNLRGV